MQLTTTEKCRILNELCKANGITVESMNRSITQCSSRNTKESAQANAKIDAFMAQFNVLCQAAAEHKEMLRNDKGLSRLRRLVEANQRHSLKKALEGVASTMTPLDSLKLDAKDANHRSFIEGMVRNKKSVTLSESIAIYSATRKYSGNRVSESDVQRFNLAEDAVLRRAATSYCKRIGLKVS